MIHKAGRITKVESEADWKKVEYNLFQRSRVKLQVDQYDVIFILIHNGMKASIVPVIDGDTDFKWIEKDCEVRNRFGNKRKLYRYKQRERKSLKKRFSKRRLQEMDIDPDEHVVGYDIWRSWTKLKKHLVETSKKITYIPEFTLEDAMNEYLKRIPGGH